MQTSSAVAASSREDDLIRQTLWGDRDAFTDLLLKYKDSLYDLAVRVLGNRTDAEDVLQDAFVQAYKHLPDFNHQSRFSTWIYSIVLNKARNFLRHNRVIRWTPLDVQQGEDSDSRTPEISAVETPFHVAMEDKLELEAVQREVRFLPAVYREIFILHYFQTLSMEEISVRLNRPLGTIKVYLHRTRKLLYKRLQERERRT